MLFALKGEICVDVVLFCLYCNACAMHDINLAFPHIFVTQQVSLGNSALIRRRKSTDKIFICLPSLFLFMYKSACVYFHLSFSIITFEF
jgi:hypothetical protein